MNKLHSAFLVTNLLQSNIFSSLVLNLIIFAQYFNVKSIKELFNDMPTQKILNFLKEIGLFSSPEPKAHGELL